MASSVEEMNEVVSLDLPAPTGWNKKLVLKKGGTPKKNQIIFTAPTGEEITTRKQLELYLKSHPGGPSPSDFDWGTGETPRRSARISEKAKATPPRESEPPKKRGRKSPGSKKKEASEGTDDAAKDVEMEDAEKSEKDIPEAAPGTDALKEKGQHEDKGEGQSAGAEADKKDAVKENENENETTVRDDKAEDEPLKVPDESEGHKKNISDEVSPSKDAPAGKASDGEKGELADAPTKEAVEQTPVEAETNNGTEEAADKQVTGAAEVEREDEGEQKNEANIGSDARGDMIQNGGHVKGDEVQP